jgi:RNA polymerase sigma-70 factor (ECF subfamily)
MLPMIYMALVDDDDLPQFEEIYTQYKQQLYGIAYKILNNEQDAEDAVQITFQNIANDFKKISQIPCNELPSCIVIICRNAALNIYRKNKKRAARSAYITDEIAAADVIKSCEDKAVLMNAIRQLPDEYKDILFLFDLQGFSAKQTAKMLGLKENAVRVKSFRARKMLKDILNGGVSDD